MVNLPKSGILSFFTKSGEEDFEIVDQLCSEDQRSVVTLDLVGVEDGKIKDTLRWIEYNSRDLRKSIIYVRGLSGIVRECPEEILPMREFFDQHIKWKFSFRLPKILNNCRDRDNLLVISSLLRRSRKGKWYAPEGASLITFSDLSYKIVDGESGKVACVLGPLDTRDNVFLI